MIKWRENAIITIFVTAVVAVATLPNPPLVGIAIGAVLAFAICCAFDLVKRAIQ